VRRLWAMALGLGMLAANAVPAAADEPVALHAADGTALSASWHAPAQPAPAVVLVHMLTRSRRDWDATAGSLNLSGFGVLALDLRGHGESGGTWGGGLAALQQDVQAAVDWLEARPEVLGGRIGIAGASLGASLAVLVAADDPSVRSVALLSPASDYRGLRCEAAVRRFADRAGAMMLVASTGDPYALRTAHQFESMISGARDLRVIDGTSAHGTTLLLARPDLIGSLVDWFRRSLL
jgi:alpha-beta hydrolase superfamily lysophospholipase